ncbi:VOC family protein [Pseudarthrobacter sulfonivorans]|uniref:VOC family protein n=1 Tax=Pseudarthrobacter sulfonivorans TaxID=121292 RepID=UPI00285A7395|nr:VOC family protein [Pseudarthrobacter sulfonivorans]MDR6415789.1 catechol 2,3-dioxygenase-like lactoylglutathione lyase family enzyme [Pseudarthrobacter sulfonivorans]
MSRIMRFDHVGVTVQDLDQVTAFFVGLGLEIEGRTFVEGDFIDTVIAIPDSRTEIVMLRMPDGGTGVELSSFVRPEPEPGSPAAMVNELGLRSLSFEVDDLEAHGRCHRPARSPPRPNDRYSTRMSGAWATYAVRKESSWP